MLTQRRIHIDPAGQEHPGSFLQQQTIGHICKQEVFGTGIPPTGKITIALNDGVQIIRQRIQTLGGIHHSQVGIESSGIIDLVDGVAVLIISKSDHLAHSNHLLQGNTKPFTAQVDHHHGAILGVQVIVPVRTQHQGIQGSEVQVNLLRTGHKGRGKGQLRQIGRYGEFLEDAIRHTEQLQDRLIDAVCGINSHHIGLTGFRYLQGEHIVFQAGVIGCGLAGGLPVFQLCAGFAGGEHISTGLGRLKQEIGLAHRLQLHIGAAHLDIKRLIRGSGSGRLDLSAFAADLRCHHNGGAGFFSSQLQAILLITQITVLTEQQFHGILAANQFLHGNAILTGDQGDNGAVLGMQLDHHIGVRIAVTIHHRYGIRDLALAVLQLHHYFGTNTEFDAGLLHRVAFRRHNGSRIAAGRQ